MVKRLGFAGSILCLLILSVISTVMKTRSKDASGSDICSNIKIPFLHDLVMNICFEGIKPISMAQTNSTDVSDDG